MTVAYEAWPNPAPAGISTEIIAFHQPEHPASKEYAKLLDAMLQPLQTIKGTVLLIVGRKPRVGASTVLLNLAVGHALKQKLRVIVVDANVQGGGLAHRLGEVELTGLAEVMEGAVAWSKPSSRRIAEHAPVPPGRRLANRSLRSADVADGPSA